MTKKIRLSIQLPAPLVKVIDILRVDAPRSDIINYFMTWYIEENLPKLMATEAEMKRIRKLLSESRDVR
jgi:hypothetical protein